LYEFRQGAEATIGVLFFAVVVAIVLAVLIRKHGAPFVTPINFATLPDREFNRTVIRMCLMGATVFLMIAGFFHSFGKEWLVGYQTMAIAVLGFYSAWTEDREHTKIFLGLSMFNWFCICGKVQFLNYNQNLAELMTQDCESYFADWTKPLPTVVVNRCLTNGFLNWLRLIGLTAILFQAIAVYLAYRMLNLEDDTGRGDYTQVADAPGFYGKFPDSTSKPAPSSAPSSGNAAANSPSLVFSSPYQQDAGYQSSSSAHDDNLM